MSEPELPFEGGVHPLAHSIEAMDTYVLEHGISTVADYRMHRQSLRTLLSAESLESEYYEEAVGVGLKSGAKLRLINDGTVLHLEVDASKIEGYFAGIKVRANPYNLDAPNILFKDSEETDQTNPWDNSDNSIQLELVARFRPIDVPDGFPKETHIEVPLVDIKDMDFLMPNHPFLQDSEAFSETLRSFESQDEERVDELIESLNLWCRFIGVRMDLYFLPDSMFHAPLIYEDFKSSAVDPENQGILEYQYLHKFKTHEFDWRWEQRVDVRGVDFYQPVLYVLLELLDTQDIEDYGTNFMYVEVDNIQFGQHQEVKSRITNGGDIFRKEKALFAKLLSNGREQELLKQIHESEDGSTHDEVVGKVLHLLNKGGFSRILQSTVALGFAASIPAELARTVDGEVVGYQIVIPAFTELIGKLKSYELTQVMHPDGSESIEPLCVVDVSGDPYFAHLEVDTAKVPISFIKNSEVLAAVYLN
jgi:hypothetical protein